MNKFIVLLRGINVGGKNIIKMEELRALCLQLGFKNVSTYKQSGNLILYSNQSMSEIKTNLEVAIKNKFGWEVPVLVLPNDIVVRIDMENPLMKQPYLDKSNLYFTFLFELPSKELISGLNPAGTKDIFEFSGNVIYLYCPDGYGKTKWNNNFFESKLKLKATTRNWQTVQALLSLQ